MPQIDTSVLTESYDKAREAVTAANDADFDMTTKYDAAIAAIRAYNSSREETIAAVATVERTVTSVRDSASALLEQSGEFPPAIPEPEPWAPSPAIRGARKK